MKKYLFLISILLCLAFVCSCGGGETPAPEPDDGTVDNGGNTTPAWGESFTMETAYAKAVALGYGDDLATFMASIQGKDGVGIQNVTLVGGNLAVVLTNGTVVDCGSIKGDKGDDGAPGKDGVGVSNTYIEDGKLYVTLTDGSTVDCGNIKGDKGDDGVGVTNTYIEDGKLFVTLTDGSTVDCGRLPTGGSDGFVYKISKDGTGYAIADIGEYGNPDVVIPATYKGKPVTEINANAFSGYTFITSVNIPESVTSIGGSAFDGCTGLTSVTIPSSVTSIGGYAFDGCTGLTAVHITDIAAWCQIKFANSTANPNYYALYVGGEELQGELVIPNGVTSIGDYAFDGYTGLASITIPSSVTSIGGYAFSGCTGLTSVTIPSSVTSIGGYAFDGCTGLTAVHITDIAAWGQIEFANSTANPNSYAKHLYVGGEELQGELVIPDGVTSIGDYAFRACKGLTSVTIPSSVTSIGESAFEGCTGLTEMTIPFVGETKDSTSNTHIGYIFGAYSYYDNDRYVPLSLKTVVITGGSSIGGYAFEGCTGLTSVTIPSSVTSIGGYAFTDCTGLITADVASGEIGFKAFAGCSTLQTVTLGDKVTSIGEDAFRGCTGLTEMTIPFVGETKDGTSHTHIGYIFGAYNCSDNDRYVPLSLKTVVITGGSSIGDYAFWDCTGLTSVTIPSSVTSIGNGAFEGCTGLTSVTIPSSVTSIGIHSFSGISGLSIVLSGGITGWYYTADRSAWENKSGGYALVEDWYNSNTFGEDFSRSCYWYKV